MRHARTYARTFVHARRHTHTHTNTNVNTERETLLMRRKVPLSMELSQSGSKNREHAGVKPEI